MIDKQYVINNVSNIEKLPNITILKMLMQFKEQLETSGAYHSITIGEVKTLEAEEPAYVENVGTTTDLILNFGIPKGVGYNYMGLWVSEANEYHPNDVVLYNGSLYICVSSVINSVINPPTDSEHWLLFVGFGEEIGEFIKELYQDRENIAFKEDLAPIDLWDNANSTAEFGTQDIFFSRADYVRGTIYCRRTDSDTGLVSVDFIKGWSAIVSLAHTNYGDGPFNYERRFNFNANGDGVTIGNCYEGYGNTESVNNLCLIPVKIVGYKY